MKIKLRIFAVAILGLLLSRGIANAQVTPGRLSHIHKMALVIGNGAYKASPLKNPPEDANRVGDALSKLGFEVTVVTDADFINFRSAIDKFAGTIPSDSAVLVYYSGHGMTVKGENYIIPTDFALKSPDTVAASAISVSGLLRDLGRHKPRATLLVLDACRNNPFSKEKSLMMESASSPGKREGDKSATRSLVLDGPGPEPAGSGVIIAFATEHGKVAADESLFRDEFIRAIGLPGLDIREVFMRVKEYVYMASGGRQLPCVYDGLAGRLTLHPSGVLMAAESPAALPPLAKPKRSETDVLADAEAMVTTVEQLEKKLERQGESIRPEIMSLRNSVVSLLKQYHETRSQAELDDLLPRIDEASTRLKFEIFGR
jgi:uncharacterized caspase-like protein